MHIADFHVHSHCSPDAVPAMDEIAKAALRERICELAITDHYDFRQKGLETGWIFKTNEYFEEFHRIKKKHEGRVALRSGVEIAQPHLHPELSKKFVRGNEFDFVLGSVHNLKNDEEAHILTRRRYFEPETLFRDYFEEVEGTILWGEFDSLAHITYPERYIFAHTNKRVDFSNLKKELSYILRLLVQNNKGLEVNTSGLRRPLNKLSADEYILSLYKKLGGEIVTIGSDAHETGDLGAGFSIAAAALKNVGFSKYATFEKREIKLWEIN